ncbi:CcdC protein domain-containing protein [Sphingomonas bacterium]|uniref:CcdC protein domain-containing protein n=1 Tax=Sphingomonas bacterium TaxID=1895847 RepID=UPI0015763646|nr:CcdC protein domain-containing protein [Sphingomonas bacterium]
MHGQVVQPGGIGQYLIPLVVFVVIFALRVRRMSQLRPLKLEQLWIVPAIYLVVVAASFVANPPTPIGWAIALAGLTIGCVLGWYRGKTVTIHVDPATHALNQKASPLGMLILLVLVGAKIVARGAGQAAHLDVASLTDALLGLALGTFAAMRIEMYLRGSRLVARSRAANAGMG